jgi:hypothetical protein
MGVFVELEKVYDLIWREGLLSKIKKVGVNGNMFGFIQNLFSESTFLWKRFFSF